MAFTIDDKATGLVFFFLLLMDHQNTAASSNWSSRKHIAWPRQKNERHELTVFWKKFDSFVQV
jgi:hypothetical protein